MLRARGVRRRTEAIAKLTALACVLPGGLRGELDREWCASVGGDQTMGGAVPAFRFNPYANTLPLSAAAQKEFQVRSLEASMNSLRRRIAAICSAAEARKEERHPAYDALRCAHRKEHER